MSSRIRPLKCPRLKCRAPATEIVIYSTDLETRRWSMSHRAGRPMDNESPMFDVSSWIFTDSSDIPDNAECKRCGHEFTPRPGSYDFG